MEIYSFDFYKKDSNIVQNVIIEAPNLVDAIITFYSNCDFKIIINCIYSGITNEKEELEFINLERVYGIIECLQYYQ